MLYGCGFRISEVLNLTVADVDLPNGIVHIRDAKNGNERFVPMAASLSIRCRDYADKVHHENMIKITLSFSKKMAQGTV